MRLSSNDYHPFHSNSNSNTEKHDHRHLHAPPQPYDVHVYLQRYDDMVRLQEEEAVATHRHLLPLLELLELEDCGDDSLGTLASSEPHENDSAVWTREFFVSDLQRAVQALVTSDVHMYVTEDQQWNMVLQLLATKTTTTSNMDDDDDDDDKTMISWAEIVHCYKTCITCVQALETVPTTPYLRDRIKQRSLRLLSTFRPSSSSSSSSLEEQQQQQQEMTNAVVRPLPGVDSFWTTAGRRRRQPPPQKVVARSWNMKLTKIPPFTHLVAFLAGAVSCWLLIGSCVLLGSGNHANSTGGPSPNTLFPVPSELPRLVVGPIVSPFPEQTLAPLPLEAVRPTPETLVSGPVVSPFPQRSDPLPLDVATSKDTQKLKPSTSQTVSRRTNGTFTSIHQHKTIRIPFWRRKSPNNLFVVRPQASLVLPFIGGGDNNNNLLVQSPATALAVLVVGGASTIGLATSVLSSLPAMASTTLVPVVGVTVVLSTLLAHGIRDLWYYYF